MYKGSNLLSLRHMDFPYVITIRLPGAYRNGSGSLYLRVNKILIISVESDKS